MADTLSRHSPGRHRGWSFQSVGWAKARLRRTHHLMLRTRWWARFALPTLRTARASAISRLNARGLQSPCPSLTTEGAGKTGCALHPRSRVQSAQKKAHTSIQVQRRQSGLPCAVVYGLLRALPGDRLSCHRHFAGLIPRNLAPAPGRQDHTTSPSASHLAFVFASAASTASHRTFVTIASRPSSGETGGVVALICPTG